MKDEVPRDVGEDRTCSKASRLCLRLPSAPDPFLGAHITCPPHHRRSSALPRGLSSSRPTKSPTPARKAPLSCVPTLAATNSQLGWGRAGGGRVCTGVQSLEILPNQESAGIQIPNSTPQAWGAKCSLEIGGPFTAA